jgi:hypothetical protein
VEYVRGTTSEHPNRASSSSNTNNMHLPPPLFDLGHGPSSKQHGRQARGCRSLCPTGPPFRGPAGWRMDASVAGRDLPVGGRDEEKPAGPWCFCRPKLSDERSLVRGEPVAARSLRDVP